MRWRRAGRIGAGWGWLGGLGVRWRRAGRIGAGWGRLGRLGAGRRWRFRARRFWGRWAGWWLGVGWRRGGWRRGGWRRGGWRRGLGLWFGAGRWHGRAWGWRIWLCRCGRRADRRRRRWRIARRGRQRGCGVWRRRADGGRRALASGAGAFWAWCGRLGGWQRHVIQRGRGWWGGAAISVGWGPWCGGDELAGSGGGRGAAGAAAAAIVGAGCLCGCLRAAGRGRGCIKVPGRVWGGRGRHWDERQRRGCRCGGATPSQRQHGHEVSRRALQSVGRAQQSAVGMQRARRRRVGIRAGGGMLTWRGGWQGGRRPLLDNGQLVVLWRGWRRGGAAVALRVVVAVACGEGRAAQGCRRAWCAPGARAGMARQRAGWLALLRPEERAAARRGLYGRGTRQGSGRRGRAGAAGAHLLSGR